MPTFEQLRVWVNYPRRKKEELVLACEHFRLPLTGTETVADLKMRLLAFLGAQPQMNAEAHWTPPGWVPPAATVPPAEIVHRVSEREEVERRGWRGEYNLLGLFALAFVVLPLLTILGFYLGWWQPYKNSDQVTINQTQSAVSQAAFQLSTPAASTVTPTATPVVADTGKLPALDKNTSHGKWDIKMTSDIDKDPIVRDWLVRLKDPAPQLWKTYPNIPNPDVKDFRVVNGTEVPDGMEYGVPNVPFCQQDMRCDFVVPAQHYRLITADYQFLGTKCGGEGKGCLLLLINVSDKSVTFRNQMADNGFSVPGRYWNGDVLEWGAWGLVSHASANMLNMPTKASSDKVLNAGGPNTTNGGANCGVPGGCKSVDATIVVHAADRILAVAKSTITR